MSLQSRLLSIDTIADLEAASANRLDEAGMLRSADRNFWSIYTYGYVVEILLKAAFFRLSSGCGDHDEEDVSALLKIAKDWAGCLDVATKPRNLHDLLFWAELLVEERAFSGDPFSSTLASELVARVATVAGHWCENMRYHPAIDAAAEIKEVEASVTWLASNYHLLWR